MKCKRTFTMLLAVLALLSCFGAPAAAYYDKFFETDDSKYICVMEARRNSDGSGYQDSYTYDDNGNLTEETYLETAADGSQETTVTRYYFFKESNTRKEVAKKSDKSKAVALCTFDSKGREIKTVDLYYEADGSCSKNKTTYSYDSKDRVIKTVRIQNCSGNSIKEVERYAFDSKGNETKHVYLYTDNEARNKEVYLYTYDRENRLVKAEERFFNNGALFSQNVTLYTYNKTGELITEDYSRRQSDGDDYYVTTTYTYDKKGRILQEAYVCRDANGETGSGGRTYAYDKNGNETLYESVEKTPEGVRYQERITSVYNEAGQPLKTVNTWSGTQGRGKIKTGCTYDKNGNLLKTVRIERLSDESKQISRTFNTYDKKGNLIKEVNLSRSSDGAGTDKHIIGCVYDDAGNLLKQTETLRNSDGTTEKSVFTYRYIRNPRLSAAA